jgi:hypothetical protein
VGGGVGEPFQLLVGALELVVAVFELTSGVEERQ